jgi:hypothetical protein
MADTNQLMEQQTQALQSIADSLKAIATALQNTAVDTDLQATNRLLGEVVQRLPAP